MSTFWDNIQAEVKEYPAKAVIKTELTLETVWDNIPEQSLVELSSDCVHHFTIPTGSREVIGQCKKCNGERWFKNYLEEQKFNKTAKPIEHIIAEQDMQKDGIQVTDLDLQSNLEGLI
tara:strand:- start:198 stop:551 length:354 start_codon:yes stop_codon:yes gene_type:complete